jgi:hypothetical protein
MPGHGSIEPVDGGRISILLAAEMGASAFWKWGKWGDVVSFPLDLVASFVFCPALSQSVGNQK